MTELARVADLFVAIVEACSKMTRDELTTAGAALAAGWLLDSEREALAPLRDALEELSQV